MTNLTQTYNPANASALTPTELEGLQKLTSPQIKELALAYPNAVMQRAYLLIIDSTKPAEKQLPSLSTFENLYNLREKNGLRHFVAYAFKESYKPRNIPHVKGKTSEVIDLSDVELLNLPGMKTAQSKFDSTTVEVKKINKKQKQKA